jgi:hypothetical protein
LLGLLTRAGTAHADTGGPTIKHALTALAVLISTAAHADVVVIVNPAAGALTQERVANIYLGRSNALTPLDQRCKPALLTDVREQVVRMDRATTDCHERVCRQLPADDGQRAVCEGLIQPAAPARRA